MKVESGMTHVVDLPFDEADKIMEGMEQAEKTWDLEGLRWCARMIRWLWDQGDVNSTDTYCYTENLFNCAWKYAMEKDPPPASIAAIVAGEKEEGPGGEDANRALDTLAVFFEENPGEEGPAGGAGKPGSAPGLGGGSYRGGSGMIVKPIMKPDDVDSEGVSSIMLYPAERVREIFKRVKAAKGTQREAAEYRIFALRMERLYDRYSLESNTCLEDEDALRWAAIGEAAEDAEFVASIAGGNETA
jgi:hypothetical protein